MKVTKTLTAMALTLVLVPTMASAAGNVNFILAGRGLDEDFWRPTEEHGSFGINFDFGKESWPVHLAIGAYGSGGTQDVIVAQPGFGGLLPGGVLSSEIESTVGEFSVGVLWRPKNDRRFNPYVGGGLAFVEAEKKATSGLLSISDEDDSTGLYINGGVAWRVGKHFNVGLDARLVTGTGVTLFGEAGDADYLQFGVLLGYGW